MLSHSLSRLWFLSLSLWNKNVDLLRTKNFEKFLVANNFVSNFCFAKVFLRFIAMHLIINEPDDISS